MACTVRLAGMVLAGRLSFSSGRKISPWRKKLEALVLERLSVLLIEISAGNAAAKRRLRMELAGAQSRAKLATPTTRNKGTSAVDEPHSHAV
jgi:hypothetical protein